MIVFIVALKSEAESFINKNNLVENGKILDKPLYSGKFLGNEVRLLISGIGKVSASLTTQVAIDTFKPDLVVNFGTCGGVTKNIKPLSFYVVERAFQFDFDITEIDNVSIGYIQEYNSCYFYPTKFETSINKTTLATADRFTSKQKDIDDILSLGGEIRDMEGCAIAQVATSNSIPLLMLKGVTDVYGSGNDGEQFLQNLSVLSSNFPDKIEQVIKEYYKIK